MADPQHDQQHDTEQERPTVNHPLHGEPRPRFTPLLATLLLLALIAVVFAVITWARYNT